jgi:outer membrane receptor protein involved in Fe transport
VIDPESRLTLISGASNSLYQIPNNPGQPTSFVTADVTSFDSALLNERLQETSQFNVLAYQHSAEGIDTQIAYFNRYNQLHFWPDPTGDLLINGVASSVYRQSYVNGIQEDTAWRIADAHTLRFGLTTSAERSLVTSINTTFPGDPVNGQAFDPVSGNPLDPVTLYDSSSKLGWLFGAYVQDEWKITDNLTLNAGLRFDQMWQFVDANQFSPRISLTWVPFDGTTFHAGYARTFTPPQQVIAAPTNIALFQGTVAAPGVTQNDPVLPERADIFDVGVVQKVWPVPGLEVGLDGYYKIARDLLDDGQFGQAYVLDGFNYDKANNLGLEFKATYTNGNLKLYGKGAPARHQHRLEPVPVWRGRVGLYRHPLYPHRPFPRPDRLGGRLLPMVRHEVYRIHDLWQRASFRLRQPRSRAVLHPGQYGRVARLPYRRAGQADHTALRRRERVRQDL